MSDTIEDVPISCATGNCTWPVIPTLGVCGACVDMGDELISNCGSPAGMPDEEGCFFEIEGGLRMTKPVRLDEWNETTPLFIAGPGSNRIFDRKDLVGEGEFIEKISLDFIGMSYAQFVDENLGSYIPANRTLFNRANVVAYECGLWYCLQARSVNASNGVVHDTLLEFRNGHTRPGGPELLRFNDDPALNVDNITSYDINEFLAVGGLKAALEAALTGSMTIDGSATIDFTPTVIENATSYRQQLVGSTADCLHAAWVFADDIDAWWGRITKSLTNNIRVNGKILKVEDGRYSGVAWTEVVHIRARWLWLIFPIILVGLSTMFLVATVLASWRAGLMPWKSFILPVVYARLENNLQEEWKEEYARKSGSLAEVKNRWSEIDRNDDAWIFRHVNKEPKKTYSVPFAGDTSIDG